MKTNIQKGKKVASAVLAGVLAMGMCVPAVSFSAFTSPEVAVAAEGNPGVVIAEPEPIFSLDLTTTGFYNPYLFGKTISVAGDYGIANYVLCAGDKTSGFTGMAGEISASIDVSDFAPGTYPVVLKMPATEDAPEQVMSAGTLTVAYPTTLALKTPAAARMTSDATLATGTEYTAIKVFDADITGKYGDENAPKGTNIQFANGVNADVIKAAGDPDFAEGVDAAHQDLTNAQNAAEYLNANIAHQPGVGLTADSYGISLAKRLMAAGADTKTIVADGDKVQLDGEGYYLIVRTSDLTGENTAATSPIFAALDEGDTEITLKVAIPTITKQIQEDGDNSAVDDTDVWGDEADHTLNQDVNYRLIGTIAENVDAFATYEYNFKDSWDATKLALHADSVKVVVKTADTTNEAGETVPGTETDITDAVKAGIKTDEAGKLEVNITDLKAIYPTLTATDQVIVSYTAEQCGTTASPEGIENTAFLEYANNPVFASKGMTPEVSVKDYSYALRIHKVDNSTKEDLAGVEFSIKNSAGKFLALVDGEVVEQDAEYAWTTDAQGRIMIDGVDADTYTVAETKALDAYDELGKDITMTINAADRDAVVGSISSESALVGEDTGAADKNDVVAQVLVNNVKQIPLPSTGELGLGLVIFLAVAAGFYAVSRRRKQEETRTLVI